MSATAQERHVALYSILVDGEQIDDRLANRVREVRVLNYLRLPDMCTLTATFPRGAESIDEHPFTVADWDLCAEVFPRFWHREVELTSIPLMPLNLVLPRSWQRALAARVSALDDRLLARYPQLRRFARSTFLVLE